MNIQNIAKMFCQLDSIKLRKYLVMMSLTIGFGILNDVVSVSMHGVYMLKVQSFHLIHVLNYCIYNNRK